MSKLREARLAAGLTQVQLAERSQVSDITICRIEVGRQRPRVPTARKLLNALKIPLDRFREYFPR